MGHALPDVPLVRCATAAAHRAHALDARGIGGEAAHSARGMDGHGTPRGGSAGDGPGADAATGPDAWPGWQWGVRAPEAGETPLSFSEALQLLTKSRRKALEAMPEFDFLDFSPLVRTIRPAGTWGIYSPGLRKAGPFDWLVDA